MFRVGRVPDGWRWPDWAFAQPDRTFGNRWDDPLGGYRVLYACSDRLGALLERLAQFRPELPLSSDITSVIGGGGAAPGRLPAAWLEQQTVSEARLTGDYAYVGHSRSLAFIRSSMATRVREHGWADLDAATIRLSTPRRFTQEISRAVYEAVTAPSGRFAGIRYGSRLGDEFDNWAVFESTPATFEVVDVRRLTPDDIDLQEALRLLDVELY